jgi:acetylornithine/LysW-gamma-L-lysine aminotransferase
VLVEDSVPEKARAKGLKLLALLKASLSGVDRVKEVRGRGLMVGVELRGSPQQVIRCLQERGRVLALRAGLSVVRFLPPYTLGGEDLRWLVDAFLACIEETAASKDSLRASSNT